MKKINFKNPFLFAFASLRVISMDTPERPTEFLFDAMRYYEQGDYVKSAEIFKRYAGKPVPVAEPFCLELVKKEHLEPFEPVPSNHEKEVERSANMYFEAAQEFVKIKNKKSNNPGNSIVNVNNVLEDCRRKARNNPNNGPFLYLIGVLYESTGKKKEARLFFSKALDQDLRAVLGLGRVCSPEQLNKIVINGLPFSRVHQAFSLMPVLHQDEGKVCFTLSGFLKQNSDPAFLKYAALFGHGEAQFLWWQSHCQNESQALYWMMQSAAHGNLEALSLCGHMLECGKGTSVDYEKAHTYLKRAAHHPDARAGDFFNFAVMHEAGKGTPVDAQEACKWYQKAYEADPNDQQTIYKYGRLLGLLGDYQRALPLLSRGQSFSDEVAYNYAVTLEKLRPEEGGDLPKAVSLLSGLASKGYLDAANTLVRLVMDDKAPHDTPTLQAYKSYLEDAIQKPKFKESNSNKQMAKAYLSLCCLYEKEESLFPEGFSVWEMARKAFQLNPENLSIKAFFTRHLGDRGSYQEALKHFLSLEKVGYPDIFNNMGVCYDKWAQQTKNLQKARERTEKALAYYQKEAEANGSDKAAAAFNIYCLLVQARIEPPFEGSLLHYLQIAADEGDEEALNDLGGAYMWGLYGLDRDLAQAEPYLKKSIGQGCLRAKASLMHLKFMQGSEEAQTEANQLYNELCEQFPDAQHQFKQLITSVEEALDQEDEEDSSQETSEAKGEKAENGPTSQAFPDSEQPEDSECLSGSLSVPSNGEEVPELKEDEQPMPAISLKQQEKLEQPSAHVLTKRQKEEQEEKSRLQRKYQRLMERVEELRAKKQVKYRKIHTIIRQHADAFGGAIKNAKGSGRRMQLGSDHSGFHQPHGYDGSEMKGGALRSVAAALYQSHGSSSSSSSSSHKY